MNYKSAILVRLLWRYEYYCLLNPEERTEEEIQNKENKMTMPEELKGYKCPGKECYECKFLKTKCIVYSAEEK